jgi:predicted kinase
MPKISPNKPLLILLYGFPGAGKTYFARQLCEEIQAAHLQGDRIRGELFEQPRYDKEENGVVTQLMDYMAEEFLAAGLSIVYDVNAMRLSQRHALREMARRHKAQPLLVWLQIDPESAFMRIVKRDHRKIDDKFAADIDQNMFEHIMSGMQNPGNVEDYIVVSGKHVFPTQFSAMVKRLHAWGLIPAEQMSTKIVKPGMVNLVPKPMVSHGPPHSPTHHANHTVLTPVEHSPSGDPQHGHAGEHSGNQSAHDLQAGRVDMSRRNIFIR